MDTTEGLLVEVGWDPVARAGREGLEIAVDRGGGALLRGEGLLVEIDTAGTEVPVADSDTDCPVEGAGTEGEISRDCLLVVGETDDLLADRKGLLAAESLLAEVD